VLISDHSSNGTWIASKSGESIKLEQGKPTLLKEGDVILLTRSTEANPEVISYKYCSFPFPRITKNKPAEALHQDSAGILECHADNITTSDKIDARMHLKRQREPYGQQSSPRKVRFKVQIEESIDNHDPSIGGGVKDEEQSTEGLDDCAGSVTGKGRVPVKELNDTTFYIENPTVLDSDNQGRITQTTITNLPCVSAPTLPSTSVSEISNNCRSGKKHDSLLKEEETTKCEALRQASDCDAPEDGVHCDKCVHCGKWIPHVTLSLHEAVCEGQSQEAKSQDHVSLSSLPLGDCSFSGETMPKIQRLEECLLNDVEGGDINISDEATEPEVTGQIGKGESDLKKIQNEAFEEKTIETVTSLSSRHCNLLDGSHDLNIIGATTVNTSCESQGKIEENTVTETSKSSPEQGQLLLVSHNEDDGFTSPHQSEPAISREESKERCTFCSKVLPVSELIVHASECSKMSAVPRIDSDDAENTREPCPYCGKYFEVVDLVEHVASCKEVSRLKAEEVSLEDGSPSPPVTVAANYGDVPSVGDTELCPKCRQEFYLFELLSHANECKEEPLSTSSDEEESFMEDANDPVDSSDGHKGVENDDDDDDSKVVIGDEICEIPDSLDRDKSKPDGHVSSSDAMCGDKDDRITEADHDVNGGSVDDINRDEVEKGDDGSDDDDDDDEENDVDDDKSSRRDTDDSIVSHGHGHYDDDSHSDRSIISYTDDEDSKSEEKDDQSDECSIDTCTNKCSENEGDVDDSVEAGLCSEASIPSDEFERCLNCFQLFHLSRLIEHASNCDFDVSALNKAVETAKETDFSFNESPLFNPPTESTIVFSDCNFCGARLPVDIMSEHYPKCQKLHLQGIINEGSSRKEKSDPAKVQPFVSRPKSLLAKRSVEGSGDDNESVPEHVIRIENLSTRTTIKDAKTVKRLASTRKRSDESSKTSNSNATKLQEADDSDDGREAGESKVSLKRKTSSLDTYLDCEEQCIYCLKMFAVSVLVEHVCSCADLYENSADSSDLEQCCYCLRTFPLNDLITHAQNCDQKTISSSQEDSQNGVIVNSQSHTGEVLERCMYCFKDFPVSKLIHHSQKCDGDMSGPRERFQGFLPSVHDLSASSSVAILNDTQRAALQYVITRSAQDSKSVASKLLSRVQRLGYSENDLKRTLQWVRSASPIIIHINLDRVLKFLVDDTHYRNRFETGTSGGSTDMVARKSWEDRIFNNAYHRSPPSDRVKYGVLNIVGDPRGVRSCIHYGDSFLQLKKVRLRTTFASQDTSGPGVKLSCCEHYENVLFSYTNQEITAIIDVATGKVPFHRSDCISQYKEVQIHGPVSLSENVECIVVNPRHSKDSLTTKRLDRFVEQNKCNLIWMDPDDLTGATPFSFGAVGHYPSAMSLFDSPSHVRRRIRRRGFSRGKRKRP